MHILYIYARMLSMLTYKIDEKNIYGNGITAITDIDHILYNFLLI